ncbi:MAG TPA: hypothetical protein VFE62_14385 [Gemmataceae bacterium]|nr:hypothetical protein [Gemmataceae bacterium]
MEILFHVTLANLFIEQIQGVSDLVIIGVCQPMPSAPPALNCTQASLQLE